MSKRFAPRRRDNLHRPRRSLLAVRLGTKTANRSSTGSSELRPEQVECAFAAAKRQPAWLVQDPANLAAHMPRRSGACLAVDDLDYSDHAAQFVIARQLDPMAAFDRSQEAFVQICLARRGMNEQRTAMAREPGAVLHVLVAVDDEPRPGLAHGERGQLRQGTAPSRLANAVTSTLHLANLAIPHTLNTFCTSSPKWLMTFTQMRPSFGLGNGREMVAFSSAHAVSSISALSARLSAS